MAARESEDADIMTTISVPNTNDISDDEEMSDATEKKDVGHTRRGVSPIHVPAEWGKEEPTGDDDPESLERRQQRAKRFGVSASETEEKSSSDLDLDSLYKSLGVSTRSEERLRVEGIREEAIHIRGIDNMTTQDVFHFFKDFNPGSIEWIDETSCNVMWLDDETSARALLKLTYDVEHVPEFSEPGQTSKSAVKAQEESMDVDASGGTGDNTRPRSGRRRNASDDDNLDLLSSDDSDSGHESSSKEDSEADEETGEKDRGPDEETGEKKRKSHGRSHVTAAGGASVNGTAAAAGSSGIAAKVTASGDHAEGMELEEGEIGTPRVRSFWREGKEIALPRGRWRVGLLHGKKKFLFLRFATKADVKAPGARVPSQYYMPQSLPVYTGIKGLTSESRKRRFRAAAQWGQEGEGDLGVGFDARNEILNRAEVRSSTAPEPGLTSMDRHMTAAQTERVRLHKHRVCSDEEADALDAEAELAVLLSSSPPADAPPPTKRKMRMYADDLEEQKKSKSATVVSRVASARDARSMIESRRRGKFVGSERLSHTQDDLDLSDDLPAPRPSDRRGQHRDLRDRLGRRRNDLDTDRDNNGDGLGRRKDDFLEGRRKYEKLTIEVQQD